MPRRNSDAAKAKGWDKLNQISAKMRAAMMTKRHKVYSALFLGPDGELTHEAEWFFNEISHFAGMDRRGFEPDARRADFNAARTDLVESIKTGLHLDGAKLAALNRKLLGPMTYD